ncbi:hypothetical protein C7Q91_09905 [Staphylococcus aureus]|nr:hypothetical protein C7Q91_09905 [Staphylococcus aureus]
MILFKNLNFDNFFVNMSFLKRISHKVFKIIKPENDKAVGNVVCSTADFFLSIIDGMLEEKNKSLCTIAYRY